MSSFVGTGALIRLALRRDRLMLPIWIVVLGVAAGEHRPTPTRPSTRRPPSEPG